MADDNLGGPVVDLRAAAVAPPYAGPVVHPPWSVEDAPVPEVSIDDLTAPADAGKTALEAGSPRQKPTSDDTLDSATAAEPAGEPESPEPEVSPADDKAPADRVEETGRGERPKAETPVAEERDPQAGLVADPPKVEPLWPKPVALLEQLSVLAEESSSPEVRDWAAEVTQRLREFGVAFASHSDESYPILGRLIVLGRQGEALAERLDDEQSAAALRRGLYGLSRRLDVWRRVIPAGGLGSRVGHSTAPTDFAQFLGRLEAYEASGLPSDAQSVAAGLRTLAAAPRLSHRELNRRLEATYRNANLRVVISEPLLNRLVPNRDREFQWVRDNILGTPVRGRSWTDANVEVRLLPDPRRLRIGLHVDGLVSALTSATSGPATFYNNSRSTYAALKEMTLSTRGVAASETKVDVDNNTWLRHLSTEYDEIPLLGAVARGMAESKLQEQQPAAQHEAERKVAARISRSIDQEVGARIGDLNARYRDRVLEPLRAMSLEPTMIESKTTDRRLTMRARLAAPGQLAGHTPRPRAPSDSLASIQLHESAINNLIDKLDLDGQTLTVAELRERIASRWNCPEMLRETDPESDDLTVTFAEQDAAAVRFQDGRVMIALSMAGLRKPPHRWPACQVRVFYRPEVSGRTVALVRDGVVSLKSDRIGMRSRIAVLGIFGRVFHKDRPLPITPEAMAGDRRLAGLAVTQCTIEDGWIGLALGPQRHHRHSVVAERPGEGRR